MDGLPRYLRTGIALAVGAGILGGTAAMASRTLPERDARPVADFSALERVTEDPETAEPITVNGPLLAKRMKLRKLELLRSPYRERIGEKVCPQTDPLCTSVDFGYTIDELLALKPEHTTIDASGVYRITAPIEVLEPAPKTYVEPITAQRMEEQIATSARTTKRGGRPVDLYADARCIDARLAELAGRTILDRVTYRAAVVYPVGEKEQLFTLFNHLQAAIRDWAVREAIDDGANILMLEGMTLLPVYESAPPGASPETRGALLGYSLLTMRYERSTLAPLPPAKPCQSP